MEQQTSILLVDDHALVRTGIRRLLEDSKQINIVGEAESGESSISMAAELKPDVILMDVNMPGIGGIEATRRILRIVPTAKIIAVNTDAEAPIFSVAHYGIVGDMKKVLPMMVKALRERE